MVKIRIEVKDRATIPLLRTSLYILKLSGLKRFLNMKYYKLKYKLWRAVT